MAGIWAIVVIAAYAYAAVLAAWLVCRTAFALALRKVRKSKPELTGWQRKQELAAPSRYYGDGGTIHGNGYLDVEVDKHGFVVSVVVSGNRADDMRRAYGEGHIPALTGVEVLDR